MPKSTDRFGRLKYFGEISPGNFLDWLITLCLGATIGLFTASLGGVRADTHTVLLPLFMALLVLHGIWIAVAKVDSKQLSLTPIAFLPFLAWAWINVEWFSSATWLGRIELIYATEAFILFWVLVNNVRSRAHLWVVILLSLAPGAYAIVIGFYQFFQNPNKIANSLADHGIQLSPNYLGQATGSFGDPHSFATYLLILLPSFLIAMLVPRLPIIIRVFCGYVVLMIAFALAMTQLYWVLFALIPVTLFVSVLCFRKLKHKLLLPLFAFLAIATAIGSIALLDPNFEKHFEQALSSEGEAVRLELWSKSLQLFTDSPLIGVGGGAFSNSFAQNEAIHFDRLAQTPHNDFILLLTQYGLIGFLLLMAPITSILVRSIRRLRKEPPRVKITDRKGTIAPQTTFFLTIGISSFLSLLTCALFTFVFYVPALTFYGVLFFAITVKSSTNRNLKIPRFKAMRWCYALGGAVFAFVLYAKTAPCMQAHAIEFKQNQHLTMLIGNGAHKSGNQRLLEEVIRGYEDAQLLDNSNVDVMVGLSAAHAQRYFQNPAEYKRIGEISVYFAKRATEYAEDYARAWAQLGVAYALNGQADEAEIALRHALELAPNNSNVHYYWAAFLSSRSEDRTEALESVHQALELNPNNEAARLLEQKLLIL